MTLVIEIPSPLELKLAEKAKAAGVDLRTYAQRILQAEALSPAFEETLAPVRDAFSRSGMTLDEAAEAYEAEKHSQRECQSGKRFSE